MMSRAERGFTLIELMIVVAMIAIMLSIAVPSFRSFISNYRVTTAANDFLQGVTMTRGEAIKRSARVTMLPNLAATGGVNGAPSAGGSWANGWSIVVDATPGGFTGGTVIYTHGPLPSSITTQGDGGTGNGFTDSSGNSYVSYDGTGYPRQVLPPNDVQKGGIRFTDTTINPSNRRTVCLAVLGRARVVNENQAGTASCTNG